MNIQSFPFGTSKVDYYFQATINNLTNVAPSSSAIIITDENVYGLYKEQFSDYRTIVIPAGEKYKQQATVNEIIDKLIRMEADRKTTLIGIGGGVVTDITGYVASIYMRGIRFGFVPSTLLAMVDASIGGKNGIDIGVYKNMVGVIRQPSFLLFDVNLLQSLPDSEWSNGFAEIIKHACIKDEVMFQELTQHTLHSYQSNTQLIASLVQRNALLKTGVVQQDEFEQGDRKLLNFGHTLGHAIENQYQIMHGQAVAIGMVYAGIISAQLLGFESLEPLKNVLLNYGLPTTFEFDKSATLAILKMDKKRDNKSIHYILLEKIGKGVINQISLQEIETIIQSF